ncbi:scavenger receptor cysteine-rich domain-containing protein DMBT1-like isoform X2 [Asterias amurensis]|uniref:scavenger receptor cysteine-rich domain-containing protein DMBT1-like isoform X2 n=1 Tax=Asterias amurensis TaxID=7602 RepID=UPI003AB38DA6
MASQVWPGNQFGKGTGPILMHRVSCHGDESSIDRCNHDGWFVHHFCTHAADVGVSCDLNTLPAVRLVNGTTTHEGRVEVYFKCQWGTICDYIWGLKEADTVCRQLGYPSASHAWSGAHFGQGSLPIILNQVACNGNESSLVECNHDDWFNNQYCNHGQDAGVTCETSFLTTVLVRLVNGSTPYEGRVEVYQEDIWGTICGDNWDLKDAQVICRQLGYPTATQAWQNSHFGQGERLTLWSNVTCDGNESSIAECGYSSWMSQTCSDAGGAAVRCGEEHLIIEETEKIRLVDGAGPHEGRVEILYKCFWGTFSGKVLNIREANVICRQLGFPSAYSTLWFGNFGRGTGPVLLTHMICNGDETSIDQCDRKEWFENARGITHFYDVGVICNVEPQLPPPIRLVNGNTPYEGRVEIYHKCYWGTICSRGWTLQEADVICRQLGYPSATHAWGRAHFGRGTGLLWLNVEGCNGSESNIIQCNHWGWSNYISTHSKEVGVTCSRIGLNSPSQVRLVNGTSPYEGRLEVYYKDQWGAVCNKGWSMLESSVICRQLHYPPATLANWQGAHLVQGQGGILLNNVTCIGNETSIDQCYYSDWSSDNCSHSEVVGVTCGEGSKAPELHNVSSHVNSSHAPIGAVRLAGGQTPNEVPVRLANSSFPYEGRVELFYSGQWGVLVSKSWSIEMANIVCRQLGYPSALNAWPGGHFGSRVEPVLLRILSCQGNEESIDKCDHQGWFNTYGIFREEFNEAIFDLGVTCTQQSEVDPQGNCGTATSNDKVLGILTWPVAAAGETVGSVETCPLNSIKAGLPRAVRECLVADPPRWGNYTDESCGEVITDDVLVEESTQLIKEASTITTPVKKSLGFITQVSCVVSIAAFTIRLVVNLISRKQRSTIGKAHHISIQFSLSVIALYAIFLGGVVKATELEPTCTMVSASLLYFTLTTMIWTTIEAKDIYRTLKVSSELTTLDIVLSCVIAWGAPVVAVLMTLMTHEDSYHNENYCLITFGLPMYLGLFTPMAVLFIINIILYLLTIHSLLKVQEVSRVRKIAKRLQNTIGVSTLMSLSWCFGFLVLDTSMPTYEVIFCTISSLQVVFVCIMCCVQQEEVCRSVASKCRGCERKPSSVRDQSSSLHRSPSSHDVFTAL